MLDSPGRLVRGRSAVCYFLALVCVFQHKHAMLWSYDQSIFLYVSSHPGCASRAGVLCLNVSLALAGEAIRF